MYADNKHARYQEFLCYVIYARSKLCIVQYRKNNDFNKTYLLFINLVFRT